MKYVALLESMGSINVESVEADDEDMVQEILKTKTEWDNIMILPANEVLNFTKILLRLSKKKATYKQED